MSIGIGLLRTLIEENTPVTTLYDYGIDDSFFETQKEKLALNFIKNFKLKYGKYPEIETIAKECDVSIISRLPKEPLEYWVTKIKERKQGNIIANLVNSIEKALPEGNLDKSLELLNKAYLELKNVESHFKVKDLHEVAQHALEESEEIQASGKDLPGIPFGIPSLDKLTGGMRGGDLIFLVGETGVNKSYVSLYTALQAYKNGANVMFISPEMIEKQIGRRALALNAGISDSYLKNGTLSYYGKEKIKQIIAKMKCMDNWFKILPSGMFTDIHSILGACAEYQPDFLVVDGIYLIKNRQLRTNSPWREDESIIFLLRELSLKENIPILCTTQYSRQGKNKREGARGTQSVEQTATLFLSIEFEFEEDKEMAKPITTRLLKIKKGRDGERMVVRLKIDFNRTKITEEDVLSAPDFIMENNEKLIEEI